jgi:hypothetical protein
MVELCSAPAGMAPFVWPGSAGKRGGRVRKAQQHHIRKNIARSFKG